MGVDATLFVLAPYSDDGWGLGFVAHAFRLNRDRDLFPEMERLVAMRSHHTWEEIQLPQGAHCTYSDGVIPEGFEDHENGHLARDAYGSPLRAVKGSVLSEVAADARGLNRAILHFVTTHFADLDVVLYLH